MEGFLFTLDVFFMVLLVHSVVKHNRKKSPTADLGFFAYAEKKRNLGEALEGNKRA